MEAPRARGGGVGDAGGEVAAAVAATRVQALGATGEKVQVLGAAGGGVGVAVAAAARQISRS